VTEVMVRRAMEQDADAIVRLNREMMELHQAIQPAVWTMTPDADDAYRWHLMQSLANADRMIAVAVRADEIAGFIHAFKAARPPIFQPAVEGVVNAIGVTESARRQGVGRMLVAEAMRWFAEQGLTIARASWATNNPLSGPFWVAQGFRPYQTTGVRTVGAAADETAEGRPWYEEFFDEDYIRYHLRGGERESARATAECDFVVQALDLKPGDRVLDLCCGQGRHAVELARRGFDISGADLSEYLLGLAQQAAADANVTVRFERCDMRELPWADEFDAVINMFTAFGYLESDEEDEKVLHAVRTALRPGGQLVMDLPSREAFMKMIPHGHRDWFESEGRLVLDEHTWDAERGWLRLARTIVEPDGSRRHKGFDLRVYTHPEIIAMLRRAGLEWQRTYADVQMSDFGPDSRRMLLIARKPRR
jgi:SAM-dependent methyltransferase/ribosomal protein S18 acetylase RimI-like enzyme